MSTHCYIAMKLYKEHLGVPLHLKIHGKDVEETVTATEENPYLEIYCHHDGYYSYMGKLLEKHTNYDEILDIILHGHTSALLEGIDGKLETDAYAPEESFDGHNRPIVVSDATSDYVLVDGAWIMNCIFD